MPADPPPTDAPLPGGPPTVPTPAPVTEPAERVDEPTAAPVSENQRTTAYGVELSRWLLAILGISIAMLIIYLWCLDGPMSRRIDRLDAKIVAAMQMPSASPQTVQIDVVTGTLKTARQDPAAVFAQEERDQTTAMLRGLIAYFGVPADVGARLIDCAGALEPANGADATTRNAKLDGCLRVLAALRTTAVSSTDIDHLRLMRDFAKDVSDSHQALRTSWNNAAQTILVNVLLPLLTNLLGFIFGRQSAKT